MAKYVYGLYMGRALQRVCGPGRVGRRGTTNLGGARGGAASVLRMRSSGLEGAWGVGVFYARARARAGDPRGTWWGGGSVGTGASRHVSLRL